MNEFNPSLIRVADVHISVRKIAGTRIPVLDEVDFEVTPSACSASLNGTTMA